MRKKQKNIKKFSKEKPVGGETRLRMKDEVEEDLKSLEMRRCTARAHDRKEWQEALEGQGSLKCCTAKEQERESHMHSVKIVRRHVA